MTGGLCGLVCAGWAAWFLREVCAGWFVRAERPGFCGRFVRVGLCGLDGLGEPSRPPYFFSAGRITNTSSLSRFIR